MRGRLPGGDELQCYCGILNGRWLLWLCVKGIMLLTEWVEVYAKIPTRIVTRPRGASDQ